MDVMLAVYVKALVMLMQCRCNDDADIGCHGDHDAVMMLSVMGMSLDAVVMILVL